MNSHLVSKLYRINLATGSVYKLDIIINTDISYNICETCNCYDKHNQDQLLSKCVTLNQMSCQLLHARSTLSVTL